MTVQMEVAAGQRPAVQAAPVDQAMTAYRMLAVQVLDAHHRTDTVSGVRCTCGGAWLCASADAAASALAL